MYLQMFAAIFVMINMKLVIVVLVLYDNKNNPERSKKFAKHHERSNIPCSMIGN